MLFKTGSLKTQVEIIDIVDTVDLKLKIITIAQFMRTLHKKSIIYRIINDQNRCADQIS